MSAPASGALAPGDRPGLGDGGALIKRGLDIRRLLHYVLSYPVSTAIVGISAVAHLEENVRVARAFAPLGETGMAELRAAARS